MGCLPARALLAGCGARAARSIQPPPRSLRVPLALPAQSVTEPSPLPRSLVSRRSDLLKLYEAFLDTPHFRLWWHERCGPHAACRSKLLPARWPAAARSLSMPPHAPLALLPCAQAV